MSEETETKIKQNTAGGVARATGVVSALTVLSRFLGLARDIVIAVFFGAGMASDAFFVAFKIPNLLRRLVAEGSLSTAFVPIFTDHLSESDDSARKAFGAITTFTLLLTSALTIGGMLFAPEIADFFAPGFAEEPEKRELAASLLYVMFPYVVLVSLLALAGSALNALGHFAGPAAAPALLNVALISGVLVFRDFFEKPIFSLAWAVLVGGALALMPQLYLLSKAGFRMHLRSPFKSKAVRVLILLMLPSIISASVYQIMVFINTLLASMLVEGSVSWLYYADRIFQFPLGVFSLALATAVLPSFSRLATQNDNEGFNRQLSATLGWVSFVCIPASCGLIVLSDALVRTFYEHGEFSSLSSLKTSAALWAYSVGLWSISCHSVLVRAFLAKKNTTLPAMVACATIALNILLAFVFMGAPAVEPSTGFARALASIQQSLTLYDMGHVGLALAGSIASFFSALALIFLLGRLDLRVDLGRLCASLLRALAAAAVMGTALLVLVGLNLSALTTLLLGVPGGALCFFLVARILRAPELQEMAPLFARILKRKKR